MPLPRISSPRVLWEDLRAFIADRSRHQLIAAFLAVLMPVIIIIGFIKDAKTNTAPGEQLIYVESWRADRTDEEIIAQQKIDQAKREAAQAERQRQFKEIERRFGM